MVKIKIDKLSKAYGDNELFKNISFDIMENEIIGIVGKNGSGKSTLANIIYGNENYDSGNIKYFYDNLQIGYLKQAVQYDDEKLTQLIVSGENESQFLKIGSELGIDNLSTREDINACNMSGGEKSKLILSNIWSKNYNFLIFDEPTNHMDTQGVEWLVQNIKKYKGTILIISHNRHFLDMVATSILEIENGDVTKYSGNYTDYKKEKQHKYKTELLKYQNQKNEEKKIDNQIDKFKKWAEKGHRESKTAGLKMGVKCGLKEKNRAKVKKRDKQVKSKIKKLEALKSDIVKPKEEEKVLFKFYSDLKKENKNQEIIYAKNLCKKCNGNVIFNNSDFYIRRCDKIGLVGANGSGKTTLINMILKKEQKTNGEFFINEKIKVGYLSQYIENDFGNTTLFDIVKKFDKNKQTNARIMLANVGLKANVLHKKITTLSLGQRMRIKLVFLILDDIDVLILDEPTNHLDINTIDQLEKSIKGFKGTIIVASHDKYLLNEITNSLLVFENKEIKRIDLNYKKYCEKKRNKNLKQKTNKKEKSKDIQQKMLLEMEQAKIIGELSKVNISNEEYKKLDKRYKEILKELSSL